MDDEQGMLIHSDIAEQRTLCRYLFQFIHSHGAHISMLRTSRASSTELMVNNELALSSSNLKTVIRSSSWLLNRSTKHTFARLLFLPQMPYFCIRLCSFSSFIAIRPPTAPPRHRICSTKHRNDDDSCRDSKRIKSLFSWISLWKSSRAINSIERE